MLLLLGATNEADTKYSSLKDGLEVFVLSEDNQDWSKYELSG